MTANTLSRLPLLAGSAVAASLGRAGSWTFERYMRAPLASTGLLALMTLTAMSASNALYWQTTRHPAPFFAAPADVPVPVEQPVGESQVVPEPRQQRVVVAPAVEAETTGSVPAAAPAAPAVPDGPVGNPDAFAVQKKLFELGLFNGTVDGFYGPMTANAIRLFEQRNNMAPTGAMTPDVIDAILRSDASGRVPVAEAPPQPVAQEAVTIVQPAPAAVEPVTPAQRVAQLPQVAPATETISNTAAQTIDSVVAAIDGSRTAATQPVADTATALPMMATAAQPMPAKIQVASLEPMVAPRPAEAAAPAEAAPQAVLAATAVQPANNVELVSSIQKGLASLGFYHGSIDGHPGDATAKAIREFENFHSYTVTGQVNPDLVELLRQAGATI